MSTEEVIDFTSLDSDIQNLFKMAVAVREHSYSPYSKFKVGAAILCTDGTIYTGCNVENAAYPVGICAEKTTIGKAVSEGKRNFKVLIVVADLINNGFTMPCGSCRQFIAEFGKIQIYLSGPDLKSVFRTSITSLLPHSFSFN